MRQRKKIITHPFRQGRFKIPTIHPQWLIVCILVLTTFALTKSSIVTISAISCQQNEQEPCSQVLTAELNRYQGLPFFYLPLSQIESKIWASVPEITSVSLGVAHFNTLTVDLKTAKPLARLNLQGQNYNPLIFSNFRLSTNDDLNNVDLPLINYPQFVVGEDSRVDQNLTMKFIVNLLALLSNTNSSPQTVTVIIPQEINLLYSNNRRIIVDSTQPLSRQLTTLQLFLAEATMLKDQSTLDLRFDKPVLKNN